MIDLEKVMRWTAIAGMLWLILSMAHVYTVRTVRQEITNLYLDVHTLIEEQDKGLDIESTVNPQLDTLAWCLAHTNMKPIARQR
jgi:cell division protein FtsL